jgi:hypothetical protein
MFDSALISTEPEFVFVLAAILATPAVVICGQLTALISSMVGAREIKQPLFCKFRFLFWGCGVSTPSQGFMFR